MKSDEAQSAARPQWIESLAEECEQAAKYANDPHVVINWRAIIAKHMAAPAEPTTEDLMRKIDGKFSMKYGVSGGQIVNTVSGEVIPEDEPLFLLRGRDHNALYAINAYRDACERDGCNELHMAGSQQVREKFCQFAAEHPERMKQPGITRHLKLDEGKGGAAPAPEKDTK
jgi:hypothetical protein